MLKLFSLILPALCLISTTLWSQEGILVKNIRNEKTWIYEKNSRVTFIRFNEPEYRTDVLTGIQDSSAIFGKDTIPIRDIAGIRKKNTMHNLARVAGMPLMLIGSLLMGQGIAGIYSNPDSRGGTAALILGAGIFSLGYIPYELNTEDFTLGPNGDWKIEIRKEGR